MSRTFKHQTNSKTKTKIAKPEKGTKTTMRKQFLKDLEEEEINYDLGQIEI